MRGRIDAVFEEVAARRRAGWVVVDWKTGAPPRGARAAARALQLSAYRLAWARVRGVPEHRVRGAFFHAATGETVWPDLPGAAGDHSGAGRRSSGLRSISVVTWSASSAALSRW